MSTYKVGDRLPVLKIGEMTKPLIAEYSKAAHDLNPMHTDDEFAKLAGYPGIFAQGMLGMGYLSRFIVGVCGVGKLRRIKCRFRTLTWPGEVISCTGTVTAVENHGGRQLVMCDIQTETVDGEPRVAGTATFEA